MSVHDNNNEAFPPKRRWVWRERFTSAVGVVDQLIRRMQGRPRWTDLLGETAPIIIGAQGGSATRLVGKILAQASQVNFPKYDFSSYDSWSMRRCGLVEAELIEAVVGQTHSLGYSLDDLSPALRNNLLAKVEVMCERIKREGRVQNPSRLWGWKEPRAMYYLPLWQQIFAGFRFVHIVRDVRTIRAMHIQGNASLQDAYFGEQGDADRERFEKTWAATNLDVWRWAQRHLQGRYYLLNIEKLAGDSAACEAELLRLSQFIGTPINSTRACTFAKPLRRVQLEPATGLVAEALATFGYPGS